MTAGRSIATTSRPPSISRVTLALWGEGRHGGRGRGGGMETVRGEAAWAG